MGYTHYWYREQQVDKEVYAQIREDFQKIVQKASSMGLLLGDGFGKGTPVITEEKILFNGSVDCGHKDGSVLSLTWSDEGEPLFQEATEDHQRTTLIWEDPGYLICYGDCSYETFDFPRVIEPMPWAVEDENGLWFEFCKTGRRPYDLVVTSFLVIAKHHLGDRIKVQSDGEEEEWEAAKRLCNRVLGYGMGFVLD